MVVDKEYIQNLLMREDSVGMHAVGRALMAVNKRQTWEEQRDEQTKLHNLKGFTPGDAKRGTSMANFYKRRGYLSEKQVKYWRKENVRGVPRISKYWRQLLEEATLKKASKRG